MTAYRVQTPFPTFLDTSGSPLNDGYVYIGTTGINPETSPLSLFWDADLTQPAANPVRTINGFFSRSGSPGRIYIASDECSVTVRDKNKVLAYTDLRAATTSFLGETNTFIRTVDQFNDGVGFTAGVSTQVTLSVAPASEANVLVTFDGVVQHQSTFTLSSNVITFDAAIPAGTSQVQVLSGKTAPIGASTADLVNYTAPGTGGKTLTTASALGTFCFTSWYDSIQEALNTGASVVYLDDDHTQATGVTVPAGVLFADFGGSITITATGVDAVTLGGDNARAQNLRVIGPGSGNGRGIYASGITNPSINGNKVSGWTFGIQVSDCYSYDINGNRIWNGVYNASSAADIFVYSSTDGERGVITGNFCLSNIDSGISVALQNADFNVIIKGNIVIPCDAYGEAELDFADIYQRYGIIVGYNGGLETRAVVEGNIIRKSGYAGIYTQGGTFPVGTVTVRGNIVSFCGYSTKYPADVSLRAGIHLKSGGNGDVCTGNIVADCGSTSTPTNSAGIKVSHSVADSVNSPRPLVADNQVIRSLGYGIWLTNRPHNTKIDSNKVFSSALEGIYVAPSGSSDDGNVEITNNTVEMTVIKAAIVCDIASGTQPSKVHGNKLVGVDKTTSGTDNVAIFVAGPVSVKNNTMDTFYYGIYKNEATNAREIGKISGNDLINLNTGMYAGAGTGILVVSGNTYDTVGTQFSGPIYEGVVVGTAVLVAAASIPVTGTWAAGDMVKRVPAAIGQPKGWVCDTGGAAGTFNFTSEGNL